MKPFLLLFYLLFYNWCFSQNIILDKDTSESIPYVNILVKNSAHGFYSNKKGEFVLKTFIRGGDTLVFSSLGYKPKEIIVGLGYKLDTILLNKKIENIEEVIISKPKKYVTEELGVKGRKNSSYYLGIIKLAVYIKNDSLQKNNGIIKELIYRKLKIKNEYTICDTIGEMKCKTYKIKPKKDLALKLQLYNINQKTQLPDLNSPLIPKDIFIRLDKNKTIKQDISNYNISMPEKGVFAFLEVLGVFNDNGEIIIPKINNIFAYGTTSKDKNGSKTYGKYKDRPWSKQNKNALFNVLVTYPIY